jgi:hypothetical protein
MANKNAANAAAAKAKKQKLILGVMGVALLGLGVIQGPKLLKHGNAPVAEATPAAPGVAPAAGTTPVTPTGTAVVVRATPGSAPKAILAGVTISGGVAPAPAEGQLHSFSLFVVKDPFLPQASDEVPATPPAPAPAPAPAPSTSSGGASTGSTGSVSTAAPPPTDATIMVNGRAYALTVKGAFPKAEPLFVLVSLKQKVARIGVAGGSFENGKTIALPKGKQVTLVNDATGARYVLKLVYTGAAPEQTESFTQAQK